MAIGSVVSTLIYSRYRGSIGEKILLQIGTIELISDAKHDWFGIGFPAYEYHYIFWGRIILILLVFISSRNNDELVSRIILKVKKNFF